MNKFGIGEYAKVYERLRDADLKLKEEQCKTDKQLIREKKTHKQEGKFMSSYADTVDLMLSDDYKERFIAEYMQTKIRYEKLKAFCNKIEASQRYGVDDIDHDCPLVLLREQQRTMGKYLHILEIRALIEGIEL